MAKTIIVSNRLPIKIQKDGSTLTYKTSEGGLATGLGSIYKEGNNIWVGWPGLNISKESEKDTVREDLKKMNLHPVFLSKTDIKEYYEGFSNETLWPTFHYFNQYAIYDHHLWEAYIKANQKFCDEIVKVAEPDDTIWIQDYQLLLLPQMVRSRFPNISIGFFLHIPFPSFEVFRLLPWRREILEGMLGADLLGFHTFDDMRHFFSTTSRLAGVNNHHGYLEIDGRTIVVDTFPMGIDYDKYATSAASPETIEREIKYRTSLGDQKFILSIDRLDYSKGIPQRLQAFELFLEKYPEYREKVSLIMIVVPSRDQVEKYKELKIEVDEIVGRINGSYGRITWTPIHYFYRSFPLDALSAFYRMAHVALVTPMRDGMNLVCKEYIASKLDHKGVLILSEMAGASKELSDALLINPNDVNQIADAINTALNMPEEEQMKRIRSMQSSLKRYNIHHWVKLFMTRLNYIKERQESLATKILDPLAIDNLRKRYEKASNRIIFLDYDGTVIPFYDNPKLASPDKELISLLQSLTEDKRNKVVIISGRDKHNLDQWLGDLNIDMICEHGVWLKEQEEGGEWKKIDEKLSDEWKNDIMPLLEFYVNRTPGSFIEEKDYSLVWHYRKVETGLGELRIRELSNHLHYLASQLNLQVLEGDMVVEIKSFEINKGKACMHWLEKYSHDFIIATGDDWTDEDTFKAMPDEAYTIKVGSKNSMAKYSLNTFKDVRNLLYKLVATDEDVRHQKSSAMNV